MSGRNVDGNCDDLIWYTVANFVWKNWRKQRVRISGIWAGTWIWTSWIHSRPANFSTQMFYTISYLYFCCYSSTGVLDVSAVFIFCTEIILLLYLLYLESRFLESSALRVTSSRGKLLVGCCAFVSTLRWRRRVIFLCHVNGNIWVVNLQSCL